jgi:peptidoglycan/xylan/chitin deacetylase (PgdA/CDA1 family)
VSLTFDDARASQVNLVPVFAAHPGMGYTMYINPPQIGTVGQGSRMTWAGVDAAVLAGAELGDHTGQHILGDEVTEAAYRADMAISIARLAAQPNPHQPGTNYPRALAFAYPSGRDTVTTDGAPIPGIIASLGFTTARRGAWSAQGNAIPPPNPMQIVQRQQADNYVWNLPAMQGFVQAAIAGAQQPWIITNAHEVSSAQAGILADFLDWCETIPACDVMRMSDVMGTPWWPGRGGAEPPPPLEGRWWVRLPDGGWAELV